jgi:S-DNA-T family DNA segregation ATPase FtsK/SpoIIIE
MSQATRKSTREPLNLNASRRLREGLLIITSALAVFLLLSLATYHNTDPAWSSTGDTMEIANSGGRVGAWLSDFTLYLFGYMAYLFPLLLVYGAWLFLRSLSTEPNFDLRVFMLRLIGFLLLMLGGVSLASLQFGVYHSHLPYTAGGILGSVLAPLFVAYFNITGATLLLVAILCTGITLYTGLSWMKFIDQTGKFSLIFLGWLKKPFAKLKFKRVIEEKPVNRKEPTIEKDLAEEPFAKKIQRATFLKSEVVPNKPIANTRLQIEEKPTTKIVPSIRAQKDKQTSLFKTPVAGELPSLALLDPAEHTQLKGYSAEKLEEMSREVEMRLKDFGIEVQVVAVHPGPVITRFEMQLAPGIKVSRISTLVKDLARSLSVTSVRIVEVIPGKSVVGLELPNEVREIVRLSEILSSQQYEQLRSPLALSLGKDIAGHPVIVDLAKMPHLLVAGTTGSGKSVGVNAMLVGLLYKSTPADLRMILVDPKMLELSIYQGIPHLLTPVVTDMKEAANALRWCVAEMERRYRLMAALGVRNLAGFNTKIKDAEKKGTPLPDPTWRGEPGTECPSLTTLPYIVVVIDEYADMMMVVGKKVEQLIARIAQKARAAGIHLILATQRPSVDVVTGLIKANIPTRIAFQVSSKIDSRTVLDQGGAEQLLGNGDMLYLPPGTSVPVRVHGAFVADHEVHKVVEDWQQRGQPEYILDLTKDEDEERQDGESSTSDAEADPLYDEAVQVVISSRRATISSLQRRLKIGFNRAANLVEAMERAGVVGPIESNGNREVLVSSGVED